MDFILSLSVSGYKFRFWINQVVLNKKIKLLLEILVENAVVNVFKKRASCNVICLKISSREIEMNCAAATFIHCKSKVKK